MTLTIHPEPIKDREGYNWFRVDCCRTLYSICEHVSVNFYHQQNLEAERNAAVARAEDAERQRDEAWDKVREMEAYWIHPDMCDPRPTGETVGNADVTSIYERGKKRMAERQAARKAFAEQHKGEWNDYEMRFAMSGYDAGYDAGRAEAVALLRRVRVALEPVKDYIADVELVAEIDAYLEGKDAVKCACPSGWPQEGRANWLVWKHTGDCPITDHPILGAVSRVDAQRQEAD